MRMGCVATLCAPGRGKKTVSCQSGGMRTARNVLSFGFLLGCSLLVAQKPDPLETQFRPPVGESTSSRPLTKFEQPFLQAPASAALPNGASVWITDAMAKVQPNATPGKNQWADLAAARNEFESFQVHTRAGSAPIQLSVKVSDLVNTQTGQTISSDSSVAVFREAYSEIKTLSDLNGTGGRMPDALIPVRDQYFKQPRNAFPVTVPPGETRSAWIDLYVPQNAVSGYYLATVTVNNGAQAMARLLVRLRVWNFSLPSTASLKTAFAMGYPSFSSLAYPGGTNLGQYPGAGGEKDRALPLIHTAVAAMFLDHRVTISSMVLAPTFPNGNWSDFDSIYGPLLSGTARTILPGARLTTLLYPNATAGTINAVDLKDWPAHFRSKKWPQVLFQGQCDEPPAGCTWAKLRSGATEFRNAGSAVPVLVTTNIDLAIQNNVLNLVDILTPVVDHINPKQRGNQRPKYDEWLKEPGKQLWWYQSCDQHEQCDYGGPGPKSATWPSYMIDATPVRNRVFQWMAYLYRISGELYYSVDVWGDNPWDHLFYAGGNGDGALFYPGTVDKVGGTSPIPIASIRLKLIREGMEDYEYLNALAQSGHADLAEAAARSFITNAYTFNNDPKALLDARERMGTLLHRLSIGLPVK